MSQLCNACNCNPCCCHDEAPTMQLATYPPIESNDDLDPGAGCPTWRFYDLTTEEFVVPSAESAGTVILHVCNSLEYFVGMYVSIFDGTTYVGLFKVMELVSPTSVRVLNTGVDGNQPAGYIAGVGSYVIVAQPPTYVGEVVIEPGSICTDEIGDLCVTREKIDNDAVDETKIADDAIRREHILDGEVLEAALGFPPIETLFQQGYVSLGYGTIFPLTGNTTLHPSLELTVSGEAGDTLVCLANCNSYSPNGWFEIQRKGGSATVTEYNPISHVNDSSVGDNTPLILFAFFKFVTTGTLVVAPSTVNALASGSMGQMWHEVMLIHGNPSS